MRSFAKAYAASIDVALLCLVESYRGVNRRCVALLGFVKAYCGVRRRFFYRVCLSALRRFAFVAAAVMMKAQNGPLYRLTAVKPGVVKNEEDECVN